MKANEKLTNRHKSTRAIHAGKLEPTIFGEVSVPIFQTSTFAFPSAEEGAARFAGSAPGYIYTRLDNPTIAALETTLASLEGGGAAMAAATGMAAIATVFLTLLGRGDHVVATKCIYGATRVLLETELARFGVEVSFVDTSRIDNLQPALRPNTRMVYLESPTNPTMELTDLEAACAIARAAGALSVVDNTFASPYLQRPLELGADVVVHSLTKFINGHSDVVGGAIVVRDPALAKTLRRGLILFGGTMDPHQAWLIQRGVRTLPLRLEKAQENAARLAQFLAGHPKVTWVSYPGLARHPQHAIACRQMDGFGAMICFGVEGGVTAGARLMNSVRLITLAVSLGGVETLIEHPASMTHALVPKAEREQAGIKDELVRLSVGCEAYEDLEADLSQALEQV